ncbi:MULTISPECIES: Imm50 family immunity protein [Streptomyces]|uniref:Imm50 family immunity protein n=1 Tax=Streptomyces TaxID=1883 RepID=UPI000BF1E6FF
MFAHSKTQGPGKFPARPSTTSTDGVPILHWIESVSNPQPVLAVYGDDLPTLEDVRIEEICLSPHGPTLRLRFDLSTFPANPPAKWIRDGMDVVQLEVSFGGLHEISIGRISTNPVCDLKMRKSKFLQFSAESQSVKLLGVADEATILRVSAYARGSV